MTDTEKILEAAIAVQAQQLQAAGEHHRFMAEQNEQTRRTIESALDNYSIRTGTDIH